MLVIPAFGRGRGGEAKDSGAIRYDNKYVNSLRQSAFQRVEHSDRRQRDQDNREREREPDTSGRLLLT
ncbi:MAG TPA: hypothetical protein VG273_09960 [Bryobacteraceae bacterium]|nr:hypothetical protein [Bryobacteraceae bacterium]